MRNLVNEEKNYQKLETMTEPEYHKGTLKEVENMQYTNLRIEGERGDNEQNSIREHDPIEKSLDDIQKINTINKLSSKIF